jgi:hypothetical protein
MTILKRIANSTSARIAATSLFLTLNTAPLISHAKEDPCATGWEDSPTVHNWKMAEITARGLVRYLEEQKEKRKREGKSTDEKTFGVFARKGEECDNGTIMLKAILQFIADQYRSDYIMADENLESRLFKLYSLLISKGYLGIEYYEPKQGKNTERLTLATARELLKFIENRGKPNRQEYDLEETKKIIKEYENKPKIKIAKPQKKERPDSSGYQLYMPRFYLVPMGYARTASLTVDGIIQLKKNSIMETENSISLQIEALRNWSIGAFYGIGSNSSGEIIRLTKTARNIGILTDVQVTNWLLIRAFAMHSTNQESESNGNEIIETESTRIDGGGEIQLDLGHVRAGVSASSDKIFRGMIHLDYPIGKLGNAEMKVEAEWKENEFADGTEIKKTGMIGFSTTARIPLNIFFIQGSYFNDPLGNEFSGTPHGWNVIGGMNGGGFSGGVGYMSDPVFGNALLLDILFTAREESSVFIEGRKSAFERTLIIHGKK